MQKIITYFIFDLWAYSQQIKNKNTQQYFYMFRISFGRLYRSNEIRKTRINLCKVIVMFACGNKILGALVREARSAYNKGMFRSRVTLCVLAFLLLVSSFSAAPMQQNEERQYFPETGHWVGGEFLAFYRSLPEEERSRIFGAPITEVLPDNLRQGFQFQYFERVRMDYDPSEPQGQRISLAPIGEYVYNGGQGGLPAEFSVNTPMCRLFTSTDKYVCYAFLQLYDRLDGPVLFGQPISNAEYVNDRLVQYFQNVRMEWRGEMPEGKRVVLTEIGRIDFDRRVGNANLLRPVPIPEMRLKEIQVRVFAGRSVISVGEQQQLYVLVHNQYMEPLPDAQVTVSIRYPDGRSFNYRLDEQTNQDGLTRVAFEVESARPNQVVSITAEAEIPNGPKGKASTWFRIWW
jgi:hypothetical protein